MIEYTWTKAHFSFSHVQVHFSFAPSWLLKYISHVQEPSRGPRPGKEDGPKLGLPTKTSDTVMNSD